MTRNNQESAREEDQLPVAGFGAMLLSAREEQGFSIGDMVGRIHISVRQLRALESETMEELPEPVYIRGFIRSYAKALGLDPKPLVADFNNRYGDSFSIGSHQIPEIPYSSEQILQGKDSSPWWRFAAILILVSAIAAGVWAIVSQDLVRNFMGSGDNLGSPAAPAAEVTKVEPKKANSGRVAPAPAVRPAPRVVAPAPAPKPEPPVIKAQENVPGITLRRDNNSAAGTATDNKEVKIRLIVKQDCWVRVSRLGNDSTVFEQDIPAGATRTIRGNKPLRVLIGNSDALEIELNDTLLDFSRFVSPREKTVRFRMY